MMRKPPAVGLVATTHPGATLFDTSGRAVATPIPRTQLPVRKVTHAGRHWYQVVGPLHTGLLIRQHDPGFTVSPGRQV